MWSINFFDKNTVLGVSVNEELAKELRKIVNKKFKKRKFYSGFKDFGQAADLAEMGSLSSKNSCVKYLLCVIDVFTKYVWVKTLKDEKVKAVPHGLIEIIEESKRKPNKLWVDQGREFHNDPM